MEGRIRLISRHIEGQETSDSDPHKGKLQNHLAFCTHPDLCGVQGLNPRIYMRKGLKVTYGNYYMFLGMILETSKVQKWSMGSKEFVEGQGKP